MARRPWLLPARTSARGVLATRAAANHRVSCPQLWSDATSCVPDRKHSFIVGMRNVVDVVTTLLQQNVGVCPAPESADTRDRCAVCDPMTSNDADAIASPPLVNLEDLCVDFGRGLDRQVYRRRRRSSRVAS